MSPADSPVDPGAQAAAIETCLNAAGINAFPTNLLFDEEYRLTMDPPYTLVSVYADAEAATADQAELEDFYGYAPKNSEGGYLVMSGNVVVLYQVDPGDKAETIEGCI